MARQDPLRNFRFRVEIDGLQAAAFSEVLVGETATEAVDYRDGTDPAHVRKLPGLTKYANVTFKRGIIGDLRFWNWIRRAATGDQALRADGRVILRNEAGEEVMRWNLTRCWPSKWTGPSLNAKNSEVAIESLEMQIERLEIDGQTP